MTDCDHVLHTNACQQPFLMDEGLHSISSAGFGQLVKMLITLEPHGIIGINPKKPSKVILVFIWANRIRKYLFQGA